MIRRWAKDLRHEDYAKAIEESRRVMESENLGHTYGPELSPDEQQRLEEAEYWRLNDMTLDEMEAEPLPDEHRGSRA